MKTKRAALYVRVSSGEQNTGAQERALREYVQRRGWKLQQIYRDKGVSGASSNRPALSELMKACRRSSIDVLVVWKFDRFARSLKQLMSGLEMCRALGIDFVSVTESIDTSLPSGELVFQMIGAVAQFERSLIGERVKSGLANARAKGKPLGRLRCVNCRVQKPVSLEKSDCNSMYRFEALQRDLACRCGLLTGSAWAAVEIAGGTERFFTKYANSIVFVNLHLVHATTGTRIQVLTMLPSATFAFCPSTICPISGWSFSL